MTEVTNSESTRPESEQPESAPVESEQPASAAAQAALPAPTPAASRASRARRLKSLTILAVVVWSGLVFLAWSQPWFTLTAQGRAGDTLSVTVQGAVAAPALSALALAGLALAAALAIAGNIVRIVLGILELVLGLSILASSIAAVANPVLAGQSAITTATGVAGNESIQAIATTASTALWPYLAIVAGVLMALTGILIVVTMRRWPISGRKYQPVQFAAADGRTAGNPAELFEGEPHDDTAVDNMADAGGTGQGSSGQGSSGQTSPGQGSTSQGSPASEGTPPADAAIDGSVDTAGTASADDDSANTAAVDSWDRLSRGQDPTA
ncbi:MAG: hypothetical protein JWQ64_965 [Subtercola sp.]|nr:hypothetical protein [Subtercola sp.]